MTIRKEIDINKPLTDEQKQMLEALKTRPITTDEDCHELTNEQLNKLAVGRKPVVFGNLTKEELDAELEKGMDDIRNGRVYTEAEVLEEMHRL